MPKYKLNVARDVDTDEPGVYIMNTIAGWKFDYNPLEDIHVMGFDSMKELRNAVKNDVIPCDCLGCQKALAK